MTQGVMARARGHRDSRRPPTGWVNGTPDDGVDMLWPKVLTERLGKPRFLDAVMTKCLHRVLTTARGGQGLPQPRRHEPQSAQTIAGRL